MTTATIDLANPLRTSVTFLGQNTDFSPFYFAEPKELSQTIHAGIAAGTIQNLFLVLQIPAAPFPGVSNQPPLIGVATRRQFSGALIFPQTVGLHLPGAMVSTSDSR